MTDFASEGGQKGNMGRGIFCFSPAKGRKAEEVCFKKFSSSLKKHRIVVEVLKEVKQKK